MKITTSLLCLLICLASIHGQKIGMFDGNEDVGNPDTQLK